MNKRTGQFQAPMVGGSSLLVIFAVLCMTVFALLGLSAVQADLRLSEASAGSVAEAYAAEAEAERILAQIRSGNRPAGVARDGDVYSYRCAISDTQELQVEVRVEEDGGRWTVLRWQTVSTMVWEGEEHPSVWNGEYEQTEDKGRFLWNS